MIEGDVEEWINMTSEPKHEIIDALRARMLNVENAPTEIVQHIRQDPKCT